MSESTDETNLPEPDLEDADDVEGHLRMTEEQLETGATPKQILAEAAEEREPGS
jgi:hypothetical protein